MKEEIREDLLVLVERMCEDGDFAEMLFNEMELRYVVFENASEFSYFLKNIYEHHVERWWLHAGSWAWSPRACMIGISTVNKQIMHIEYDGTRRGRMASPSDFVQQLSISVPNVEDLI